MPGLDIIRNNVIKPLLFATEKVVEQYFTQPQAADETRDKIKFSQAELDQLNKGIQADEKSLSQAIHNSQIIKPALSTGDGCFESETMSLGDQLNNLQTRMHKLTLEENYKVSRKSKCQEPNFNLKKRRFKEVDSQWDLDLDANSDSFVAARRSKKSAQNPFE